MRPTLLMCTLIAGAAAAHGWMNLDALPDPMPTHWSLDGHPDGYMRRWLGLAIGPLLSLGVPALTYLLLSLSPDRDLLTRSGHAISGVLVATATFGLGLQVLVVRAGLRADHLLDDRWLIGMLGGLFIALGLAMPGIDRNRWIGIRTPWTLADADIWSRTHVLGAWSFGLAGLVSMAAALALPSPLHVATSITALLLAAVVPVIWSFSASRKAGLA